MSVLAHLSNKMRYALLAWAVLCAPAFADEPRPSRVVSINLCTDQLAMLLAAPGQLHSVSFIALDERVSAMTEEAGSYVINHAQAEEIYLLRPDLVVAGAFTPRTTVEMLRRLDIPVTVFAPANTLDEIRARVTQMGKVLHRSAAADALLRDFDARLAQLTTDITERPRAILYYANGYTSGENTLAGQILRAAGFRNAASETGWTAGRKLPLEVLAMTDPDIVITARSYPGASRSEAVLDHPVVQALRAHSASTALADQNWVCGTPFVLRAIESLAAARMKLTRAAQ